jgi:metH: methionine synthase
LRLRMPWQSMAASSGQAWPPGLTSCSLRPLPICMSWRPPCWPSRRTAACPCWPAWALKQAAAPLPAARSRALPPPPVVWGPMPWASTALLAPRRSSPWQSGWPKPCPAASRCSSSPTRACPVPMALATISPRSSTPCRWSPTGNWACLLQAAAAAPPRSSSSCWTACLPIAGRAALTTPWSRWCAAPWTAWMWTASRWWVSASIPPAKSGSSRPCGKGIWTMCWNRPWARPRPGPRSWMWTWVRPVWMSLPWWSRWSRRCRAWSACRCSWIPPMPRRWNGACGSTTASPSSTRWTARRKSWTPSCPCAKSTARRWSALPLTSGASCPKPRTAWPLPAASGTRHWRQASRRRTSISTAWPWRPAPSRRMCLPRCRPFTPARRSWGCAPFWACLTSASACPAAPTWTPPSSPWPCMPGLTLPLWTPPARRWWRRSMLTTFWPTGTSRARSTLSGMPTGCPLLPHWCRPCRMPRPPRQQAKHRRPPAPMPPWWRRWKRVWRARQLPAPGRCWRKRSRWSWWTKPSFRRWISWAQSMKRAPSSCRSCCRRPPPRRGLLRRSRPPLPKRARAAPARDASSLPPSRAMSTTSARTSSGSSWRIMALRSSTWAVTCRWKRSWIPSGRRMCIWWGFPLWWPPPSRAWRRPSGPCTMPNWTARSWWAALCWPPNMQKRSVPTGTPRMPSRVPILPRSSLAY